jgi:hypothetical protein
MYICPMSYEKTELLTLGDYMSNMGGGSNDGAAYIHKTPAMLLI